MKQQNCSHGKKLKPPCRCGGFHFVEPEMKITNCAPWHPCCGARCCCGCGWVCCDRHPCPCKHCHHHKQDPA